MFLKNSIFFHFTKWYIFLICFVCLITKIYHAQDFSVEPNNYRQIIFNGNKVIIPQNKLNLHQINKTQNTGYNTIIINTDFKMEFIWMLSKSGLKYSYLTPGNEYTFTKLPDDTYQIFTIYYQKEKPNENTFFFEDIDVNKDTAITIKKAEANKSKHFQLLRADSTELIINQISFYLIPKPMQLIKAIALFHIAINTPVFTIHYNRLQNDNINLEWSVKGKQPFNYDDLYFLNGLIKNADTDSIVQNNPGNYAHSNFNYNFPDSAAGDQIEIAFFPGGHFYPDDPVYTLPIHISIYQDTSADIALYKSKFVSEIILKGKYNDDLASVQMRLGADKVFGFTSEDRYDEPFLITKSEDAYFGITPEYWFGKYANTSEEIKIARNWGFLNALQLFLTQTNDAEFSLQYPPKIQISNNDSLIVDKEILSHWFDRFTSSGYFPDSLRFPVLPDLYRVIVLNDKSKVAGKAAFTKATAEFDLRKEDKNPPNMTLFQMLNGKKIANILNSADKNIIRFRIEDDNALGKVQLFYKVEIDTNWIELPLTLSSLDYVAALPILTDNYYSLMINAADLSGNSINVIMQPAFLYESSTSVDDNFNNKNTHSFRLYSNYPNPFNPATTISYQLPVKSFVTIKVYDIVGNEIAVLVNKEQLPGKYVTKFVGTNLSSGIYLITLSAGKYRQTIKTLLLK